MVSSVAAKLYIVSVLVGLKLHTILSMLGVLTGIEGVKYYAEVHTSYWNSVVHTIGMPFTYLGFNVAVPALLNLSPYEAKLIQWCFYLVYMSHYATITIQLKLHIVYMLSKLQSITILW